MSEACDSIRDLLSGFVDGELSADDEARVRAHIASCVTCREALASFAAIDEAVAETTVATSEEDWETLALRVDAAVREDLAQSGRPVAPLTTGWLAFLRGLTPGHVAFGSAGAVAAVLLIVMFRPLWDEMKTDVPPPLAQEPAPTMGASPRARSQDPGLKEAPGVAGTVTMTAPAPTADAPAAVLSEEAPATESPAPGAGRVSGDRKAGAARRAVRGGRSLETGREADVARDSDDIDAGGEAAPAESPLRAIEPELLMKSDAAAKSPGAASGAPRARPNGNGLVADFRTAEQLAALVERLEAGAEGGFSTATVDTAADLPQRKTLDDFARSYVQVEGKSSPQAFSPSRQGAPRAKKMRRDGALDAAIESHRRQQDEELDRALAREVFVFAMERKREGDVDAAIRALVLLLHSEDANVRQESWSEVISMEAERALAGGDPAEALRVARTADAFLREYPVSRYRDDLLGPRVRLWAEAAAADPGRHCVHALAAAAQWEVAVPRGTDAAGAEAARRIRDHCLR